MNLKKAVLRSVVILSILALSVLAGFLYQSVWHSIDLKQYPREYETMVTEYAARYGVPEYVVYAVIRTESGFQSNKVGEDGAVGLMQLTPELFSRLQTMAKVTMEEGMLYDPETNIEYGTYFLSYLYTVYNRWNAVFAAYCAGEDAVNRWLVIEEDGSQSLPDIPDQSVRAYVDEVNEAIQIYKNLYYSNFES